MFFKNNLGDLIIKLKKNLDKNMAETKKVFDTVLRVIDAKKKLIVFYFYCHFLIRSYNEYHVFQKEFADNIILDNLRVKIYFIYIFLLIFLRISCFFSTQITPIITMRHLIIMRTKFFF